uniref:Uncharacterized protein n=1 Tax=Populus trichocarpa TaxID=3694 RepID=A0A2K1XDB3_POPTR
MEIVYGSIRFCEFMNIMNKSGRFNNDSGCYIKNELKEGLQEGHNNNKEERVELLQLDGGKYRIAWDVRIEVHEPW